jgi:hypothetical protein
MNVERVRLFSYFQLVGEGGGEVKKEAASPAATSFNRDHGQGLSANQ